MPETKHITRPTPYASTGDFHRIFNEEKEKDSLYRLSFLLTADREKSAVRCLRTGGFGEREPGVQRMGTFLGAAGNHPKCSAISEPDTIQGCSHQGLPRLQHLRSQACLNDHR
jgi:hypothetical protein